eukprot:scaffold6705_cov90-Skeletonema_dohrnii-CCMP3373.AAC.2
MGWHVYRHYHPSYIIIHYIDSSPPSGRLAFNSNSNSTNSSNLSHSSNSHSSSKRLLLLLVGFGLEECERELLEECGVWVGEYNNQQQQPTTNQQRYSANQTLTALH